MSLAIETRAVVGIYALGQWFKVKPFTIGIDAYELCYADPGLAFSETKFGTRGNKYKTYIQLSDLYRDFEWRPLALFPQHPDEASFKNPSPSEGISAVLDNGAEPEERIAFSILEVKAFKYLYNQDASNLAENIDAE
jgi:hypothetical protein